MVQEMIAYASVKGSIHENNNIPNQDNYCVKKYKFGTVLVMADGLGSKKHAEIGSKAACKAVCQAVQIWQQYKNRDIRLILPLIHSLWALEIYPYPYTECYTTCLFALVMKSGEAYAGQLGDGNIYIEIDSHRFCLKEKIDEFSNITKCLGGSELKDWVLKSFALKNSFRVMLMTDGVSETLVDDTKDLFVQKIWQCVRSKSCLQERNAFLIKVIKEWNPVNAGDDRTIISYENNNWGWISNDK